MDYKLQNGNHVLIRYAQIEDAQDIISVITKADTESLFLARESGEFSTSLEKEQATIAAVLASPAEAWFVAVYDGKIVGQCSISLIRKYLRYRHRAEVGFVILKEYWNLGIGGKMMLECLKWGNEHNVEQIELDVVTTNESALRMYKQFSFQITGMTPNALRYKDGTYADEYRMIKKM